MRFVGGKERWAAGPPLSSSAAAQWSRHCGVAVAGGCLSRSLIHCLPALPASRRTVWPETGAARGRGLLIAFQPASRPASPDQPAEQSSRAAEQQPGSVNSGWRAPVEWTWTGTLATHAPMPTEHTLTCTCALRHHVILLAAQLTPHRALGQWPLLLLRARRGGSSAHRGRRTELATPSMVSCSSATTSRLSEAEGCVVPRACGWQCTLHCTPAGYNTRILLRFAPVPPRGLIDCAPPRPIYANLAPRGPWMPFSFCLRGCVERARCRSE